jgi:beta-lactamase class A
MLKVLQTEIEALAQSCGTTGFGLAFHDLATGQGLEINGDRPFHPASLFKVCVMMELFRQAHLGSLSLDAKLPIKNSFTSIADGAPFALFREDDSEQGLYDLIDEVETIREINRLMIVQSSNLATNLLIEKLNPAKVTSFMKELGAPGLQVLRGPEDNRAYALGMNNAATANGMGQILRLLAQGEVVSQEASAAMIEVLLGQQFSEGIPAGLPPETRIAHKTGWNHLLYHDASIVFPRARSPFVLVVLTQGLPEDSAAPKLVSRISSLFASSLRL